MARRRPSSRWAIFSSADAMRPRFEFGDAVRVTRNVRNDGTFPGTEIGALLMRRGSVGHVVDIGTFLQDQIIYTVHFLDQGCLVGCREEELIAADEPWNPSRFEAREKVRARLTLTVAGEVRAQAGEIGEVIRVLRDVPGGVQYHVMFPAHVVQVPENVLEALETRDKEGAA